MSLPQHMEALAKATAVKLDRARVRGWVEKGTLTVEEAMAEQSCQTMAVIDLLKSQHRWGDARARRALSDAATALGSPFPVAERKTVGSLTDRQKRALVQACEGSKSGQ
jgi:hypothetical protein